MDNMARVLAAISVLVVFISTYGSSTTIVRNVYSGGILFEGPHWSTTENALYWIDMEDQKVFRLDYETNNVTMRSIAYGPVSLVVTVKDNPKLVLVTVRSAVYFMQWDDFVDDTSLRLLTAVDLGIPGNTANDGKVDSNGRLWFGTKSNREDQTTDRATVYMMDQYNFRNPLIKVRPVSLSNGIAWSPDNSLMYYIDSRINSVDVFDFYLESGVIRNRRTFFSFPDNNVTGPDGMTIDSDGNLWLASLGGWKVIKVSPAGQILEEHTLPVQRITSVMFGGPDLSILYVTTSRGGLSQGQLIAQPEAGSLFAIEGTGARGLPENQFVFPNAANY